MRGLIFAGLMVGMQAQAQDQSPILTLDQDRLFASSAFGQRVQADFQDESAKLQKENADIQAKLVQEERKLTEDRATLDRIEFQRLALSFDERVVEIRTAQETKAAEIRTTVEEERTRFFELAFPALFELVEETGAVAILNSNAVIFSVRRIDITDQAITRVDTKIGDGAIPDTGQSPLQRPEGLDQ